MKPLPEQPLELKALNTAALLFVGVGILMALAYIDVSHMSTTGLIITPHDIATAYYGPGMSVNTLIGLAHIHMMGLFPVFWLIGFIFVHSRIAVGWRVFWCVVPFAAFPIDVSGWFLTHYFEPFVYVTIVGGGLFILSLSVMILTSLYQLWIVPWREARASAANGSSTPGIAAR
ncbi:hypothetical protein ACS8YF_18075 [Salinisphaera sp. SWV1]|uniref:hypothetical protein n=1 Tax=Salinisphaera sp. SWV1 TaxID=3454139 RepID=UPI003F82FFAD